MASPPASGLSPPRDLSSSSRWRLAFLRLESLLGLAEILFLVLLGRDRACGVKKEQLMDMEAILRFSGKMILMFYGLQHTVLNVDFIK